MTAFTLGEAATMALGRIRVGQPARSGAVHRTGAPIRRGSIEAGSFESSFFSPPVKGETDRLLRMARAALDAGRRARRAARAEGRALSSAESAMAALTAAALRVFEEICTLARLNQGRVFPSYDHLADATALGRATIARALHALEKAGFLVRQRRFKRVEGEGAGPRYAQTSNVYRPILPQRLLNHLPRWLRPAPIPADALTQELDRKAEIAAMEATLSCRELAAVKLSGRPAPVLPQLGPAIDQRESHNDPQPLPDSSEQGKTASA